MGIRVIPRTETCTGEACPISAWEWGLTLTGYGYGQDVQPAATAELTTSANRIEYRWGTLTEWYANDERGLEQGFTLVAPLQSAIQNPKAEIVLELAFTGDLTPNLTGEGTAIEFTTPSSTSSGQGGGVRVLRYSDLRATDATGRPLPAHLELLSLSAGEGRGVRVVMDATAVYPITIALLLTTPNWTAEGNQADAWFGFSVSTAGDVNGDGYADVVGAHFYNYSYGGATDAGRAFVYHGSAAGLSATAD